MKKLIAIMLAVMLVLSASITAFAVEESDKYEQLKWDVNERFHNGLYNEDDMDELLMLYCCYGELSDGTIVMSPGGNLNITMEFTSGDYLYVYNGWAYIALYKNGEFTSLMSLMETDGLSDEVMDELCQISAESMNKTPQKYFPAFRFYRISDNDAEETLYGDVDGDDVITITDATMIQKMGIGMNEVNSIGDVNGDGRVSIMDVTLVQKFIADLGYNTGNVGQPAV